MSFSINITMYACSIVTSQDAWCKAVISVLLLRRKWELAREKLGVRGSDTLSQMHHGFDNGQLRSMPKPTATLFNRQIFINNCRRYSIHCISKLDLVLPVLLAFGQKKSKSITCKVPEIFNEIHAMLLMTLLTPEFQYVRFFLSYPFQLKKLGKLQQDIMHGYFQRHRKYRTY